MTTCKPAPGRSWGILPAVLAVIALSTSLLSACDTSPTAATVNGTRITQRQLYQNLKDIAETPGFLGVDQVTKKNIPVEIGGDYSKQAISYELTQMITAEVVHQAVVREHKEPGSAMLQAARSSYEALIQSSNTVSERNVIYTMPASFRDQLVAQVAERAELEKPLSDQAALQQDYQSLQSHFYQQVCVRQVDVFVNGSNGTVDQTASLQKAKTLSGQLNSGNPNAGNDAGGSSNCYTQAQMEAAQPSLRNTVMSLAPGHAAAPQKSRDGYTVVAVESRKDTPFDANAQKALTALILQAQPPNSTLADSTIDSLLFQAKVTVQPAYGTWQRGDNTTPSVVEPPTVPRGVPTNTGRGSFGSGQVNS